MDKHVIDVRHFLNADSLISSIELRGNCNHNRGRKALKGAEAGMSPI